MAPQTAALLRAVAALASYAQGHPTDSAGIRLRAQSRSKAETAWVQAGSPDLPEKPLASILVEERKDWTPTALEMVEIKNVTEKAFFLDTGEAQFWCPRSVFKSEEGLEKVGDIGSATVPRWIIP